MTAHEFRGCRIAERLSRPISTDIGFSEVICRAFSDGANRAYHVSREGSAGSVPRRFGVNRRLDRDSYVRAVRTLCDPKRSFVSVSLIDKLSASGHRRLSCAVATRTRLRSRRGDLQFPVERRAERSCMRPSRGHRRAAASQSPLSTKSAMAHILVRSASPQL
jgi:hypothetical protein